MDAAVVVPERKRKKSMNVRLIRTNAQKRQWTKVSQYQFAAANP